MKNILFLAFAAICLTSCFNSRILVGNIQPSDTVVEVNRQWNSHFLYGWIPGRDAKMNAEQYVGNAKNYMVKTNTTFANGLVSIITFGIYTPTQTKYYIPAMDIQQQVEERTKEFKQD